MCQAARIYVECGDYDHRGKRRDPDPPGLKVRYVTNCGSYQTYEKNKKMKPKEPHSYIVAGDCLKQRNKAGEPIYDAVCGACRDATKAAELKVKKENEEWAKNRRRSMRRR